MTRSRVKDARWCPMNGYPELHWDGPRFRKYRGGPENTWRRSVMMELKEMGLSCNEAQAKARDGVQSQCVTATFCPNRDQEDKNDCIWMDDTRLRWFRSFGSELWPLLPRWTVTPYKRVLLFLQTFTALVVVKLLLITPALLRCLSLQRYITLEDSQDGEKKDLQCRLVTLESHSRQVEVKIKNYADQSKSFVSLRIILHCISHCWGVAEHERTATTWAASTPPVKCWRPDGCSRR